VFVVLTPAAGRLGDAAVLAVLVVLMRLLAAFFVQDEEDAATATPSPIESNKSWFVFMLEARRASILGSPA
jgi:hypothetical protein